VPVEPAAIQQLRNIATLPFVHRHVAAMPDVHLGKGNRESFCSCSHGAGRVMSRAKAKRRFTLKDHKKATEGMEMPQGRRRARRDADGLQGH
jgi:RNA-splicing ligase RtcB